MKVRSVLLLASLVISSAGLASAQSISFHDAFGNFVNPNVRNDHREPDAGLDPIRRWNQIALIATGLDHTPVFPGEHRVFGEQLGPCRAARAMAIVHIAIFDAVNAIYGGYQSWVNRAGRFRSLGDGQVDFKGIFSKLTQYDYKGWAVLEWECALKHPEDGAREGAPFIKDHIIRVTERAFDDFAGTGSDENFNRKVLGLS